MIDFWKSFGMAIVISTLTLYVSFGIALEHTQHMSSTLVVFAIVGAGLTLIQISICRIFE